MCSSDLGLAQGAAVSSQTGDASCQKQEIQQTTQPANQHAQGGGCIEEQGAGTNGQNRCRRCRSKKPALQPLVISHAPIRGNRGRRLGERRQGLTLGRIFSSRLGAASGLGRGGFDGVLNQLDSLGRHHRGDGVRRVGQSGLQPSE